MMLTDTHQFGIIVMPIIPFLQGASLHFLPNLVPNITL